ncbi:hypothetical protein B0H34DRAFT_27168 [Crassisporium funariophilum]|nr:hypothetical protein B0H34DRAFT_27168 [Crassisporium funariophilum]
MNLRTLAFVDYRNTTFISLATALSALSFGPNSTIIPSILTLSVLLVYSRFIFRNGEPYLHATLLCVALAVGGSLSRLQASLQALSSPGLSLMVLFGGSLILSSFTMAALYADTKFSTRFKSQWSQVTLFPALWTTLWCTTSYISPVGHLSTWSVVHDADAYKWLIPIVGPASKDWIVAAWAVVISHAIGNWYIGAEDTDVDLLHMTVQPKPQSSQSQIRFLTVGLTLLTLPSFVLPFLPLPVSLITEATPLTVACVIPPFQHYKHHVLTLTDYIEESKKYRSLAKVLLWPEGAVSFNTVSERDDALQEVREKVNGPYVGVSFEETVDDPRDSTGRTKLRRTGMALVSQHSPEPHLVYYKRHLVPIAESFSLRSNFSLPPSIFEMPLPPPNKQNITRSEWAPGPDHTRPIALSSSICLDFAHPSPFAELDSKPALILAPARTWDRTVGYAMWLQAKQRAEELGSVVLWCDGGDGGVSGIAGRGFSDVTQVGEGSFIRTIGLPYPFNTQRTPFARLGDSVLILFWLLVLVPGWLPEHGNAKFQHLHEGVHSASNYIRERLGMGSRQRALEHVQPSLLD